MRRLAKQFLLFLGMLLLGSAWARPLAVVDTVQAPAWLERSGQRMALAPGMALENRDRLLTGTGARVWVRLDAAALFKLGENATLTVNALGGNEKEGSTAGLDLKEGALRVVVHDFRETPRQHAINVRFGAITALVRGESDITGRADGRINRVVLRDGSVILKHPQGVANQLDEPLMVYEAEPGQAPLPVGVVDRFQGAIWALATEPLYDAGTRQSPGQIALWFGIFSKSAAVSFQMRLAQAGYATSLSQVQTASGLHHELRLGQLVTEREARSLAGRLVRDFQLPEPEIVIRH